MSSFEFIPWLLFDGITQNAVNNSHMFIISKIVYNYVFDFALSQ